MNVIIGAFAGGLLALGGILGGVSAAQPSPEPVKSDQLLTYADQ